MSACSWLASTSTSAPVTMTAENASSTSSMLRPVGRDGGDDRAQRGAAAVLRPCRRSAAGRGLPVGGGGHSSSPTDR